jgi:hypothetical protein
MSVLNSVVRSWEFQLERLLLERLRVRLQAVVMEAVRQVVGDRVETEAELDTVKAKGEAEEVEEEVGMGRVHRKVKDMDRLRKGRREFRLRESHKEGVLGCIQMIMNLGLTDETSIRFL